MREAGKPREGTVENGPNRRKSIKLSLDIDPINLAGLGIRLFAPFALFRGLSAWSWLVVFVL